VASIVSHRIAATNSTSLCCKLFLHYTSGDPLKHPMFAQSEEDLSSHPLTEAFRQLREEDKSPIELCLMYKDEGNEFMKKISLSNNTLIKKDIKKHVKLSNHEVIGSEMVYTPVEKKSMFDPKLNTEYKKNMNEAYDRYSYAITLLQQAKLSRIKNCENEKDSHVDLNGLHSLLLTNRAQASFNVKNYGYAVNDCIQSIRHDPSNIKAYYKYAKSLQLLKKYKSCIAICEQGIIGETPIRFWEHNPHELMDVLVK